MALVLVLSMSVPAVALYDPGEDGDVSPDANPAFPQQCGADVMLVLDDSASLSSQNLTDMKTAANNTVETLRSSDAVSGVGVISFSQPITASGSEGADTEVPITRLDSSSDAQTVKNGIGGISLAGSESATNWEAALLEASQSENDGDGDVPNENLNKPADIVIIISDTNPNFYGYPGQTSNDNSSTSFNEPREAATFAANVLKNESTRVIGVGIPNATGSPPSVTALEALTNGSNSVTGAADPQANDYYSLDSSGELNATLTDIATQFECGVSVEKLNNANGDESFTDDENATAPGANVTYQVEVTNTGSIDLSLDSYFDDKYGTPTLNDSFVNETLAAGSSTVVTFEGEAPPEGEVKVNTFNVTASDADGVQLTAEDDTTVRSPDLQPSIAVEKLNDANGNGTFTDEETTDQPGEAVTYKINVTNDGPNTVNITDYTDDVYGSPTVSPGLVGTTLAPGESVNVTFEGNASELEGDSKTNRFTVTASDNDSDTATANDTTTVLAPDFEPSITVTKSVDANNGDEFADSETANNTGDTVTYRVNVTNDGPNSVTIDSFSDDTYMLSDSDLNQTLVNETLEPGETRLVSFEGTAPETENASKTNTFSVTATDENGDPANDSDTATVDAPDFTPLITVEKLNDANGNETFTDDETTAQPGDDVTYRVNVTNDGPNAVNISDYSDDVYGSPTVSPDLVGVTLAPGESITVTFNGSSPSSENASKTNTFSVTATDENGDEASDSDTTTVRSPDLQPAITVEKLNDANGNETFTDEETVDQLDETVTYQITVTNDGPNTVTIDSFSDDTYTLSDSDLSPSLVGTMLAPGESVNVTFEGSAPSEGDSKTNRFTVTASDNDSDTATDDDTTTVLAPDFEPSITVTKSVDADDDGEFADSETANATGDPVTYRITVTNDGPNAVNVTDYDDTVYDGLSLALVGETLAPGESVNVTFQGSAPEMENASKTNTFSVTATDENGDEASDSDTATVDTPDFQPSVTVEKLNDANGDETFSDDETTEQPGDDVTYQVTVTNDGPNAVNITDYTDDVYGSPTVSPDLVDVTLAPGESITVTFNGSSPSAEETAKQNTFNVTATDDNGDVASAEDETIVRSPDLTPSLAVTKSVDADGDDEFADSEEADDTGDAVTYRVTVTNDGSNTVTVDSFSDDTYTLSDSDLSPSLVGTTLAPGESVNVTFDGSAPSAGDSSKTNTFNVTATDDDGDSASAEDTATVTTPPEERICPRTPGFWDAHNGDYAKGNNEDLTSGPLPVSLGEDGGEKTVVVDEDDVANDVFKAKLEPGVSKKSNGITKLYIHLLAAKLNEQAGPGAEVPDNVSTTIDEADAFLADHNESDWEDLSESEQKQVLEWKDTLDSFNNGEYTDESNCIKDWWKDDEE